MSTPADLLSPEQVAELATALKATASSTDGNLHEVVEALRTSGQTALSADAVQSIAAAVAELERPLEAKSCWEAKPSRGLFFVFEGLDRSGKSTQSKRLAKHLEQAGPTKWMCFPNRNTAVGTLIDLYLKGRIELHDKTIHRLFSANRWETGRSIVEDLNKGISIVCDRYAFSGVAYSCAKGMDFQWCQSTDIGVPKPDGVFFLHIDAKVGASRASFGDERYENTTMQVAVREQFKSPLLRADVEWKDIDGSRDIEVIEAEIRSAVQAVQQIGQENSVRPIQRLWVAQAE